MSTNASRHYGEWALSSWYDILPGPDRLLEVSTSLNEDDAWRMVHSWSAKLLTTAVGSEKLQGIADSLVQQHWNQAKRMGCLGIQFTYINGFYHRFIWRSSRLRCFASLRPSGLLKRKRSIIANVSMQNSLVRDFSALAWICFCTYKICNIYSAIIVNNLHSYLKNANPVFCQCFSSNSCNPTCI